MTTQRKYFALSEIYTIFIDKLDCVYSKHIVLES
jgi:hypothetical protein